MKIYTDTRSEKSPSRKGLRHTVHLDVSHGESLLSSFYSNQFKGPAIEPQRHWWGGKASVVDLWWGHLGWSESSEHQPVAMPSKTHSICQMRKMGRVFPKMHFFLLHRVNVLPACMLYIMCILGACRGQKKASWPQELELQAIAKSTWF